MDRQDVKVWIIAKIKDGENNMALVVKKIPNPIAPPQNIIANTASEYKETEWRLEVIPWPYGMGENEKIARAYLPYIEPDEL